MGQILSGDPGTVWSGAACDSRRVAGGELFFALRGERDDGHRFVAAALERGAAAAVVERPVEAPDGAALIRVDDSLAGLHRLAGWVREAGVPRRLIAVTGSSGKTTTKELLAAMLARRFDACASPGNMNSLSGFPLALLSVPEGSDWMVAELGMNRPGEIGRLSRLARPQVAVLTNVRPVHLEFFADQRAVAEAKGEILEGLAPGAMLVANADDPEVVRLGRRHAGRVVWFGTAAEAEVRARDIAPLEPPPTGFRFRLVAGAKWTEIELPLWGRHNVDNFLAAAACAHAIGVPLRDIAATAREAVAAPMRGVVHRLADGTTLIDDAYNSNPDSLRRVLEEAAALPARRRWAVLGEMLELGEDAPRFHREGGEHAAALGFDPVAGVGELARHLLAAAGEAGVAETPWFGTAAEAAAWAPRVLAAGDLVVVKGSRSVGLEAVVTALLAAAEGEG